MRVGRLRFTFIAWIRRDMEKFLILSCETFGSEREIRNRGCNFQARLLAASVGIVVEIFKRDF